MTGVPARDRPSVANPPGLAALHRRVATHAGALERMRATLADPTHDLALRALARHGTDDPAIALLDAWAYVADVVAFYSERIAQEGYLRTATQLRSVRELARMLGYELRPGVAAQADLAFFAQDGPGTAASVTIPRGTPAQSVPRSAPVDGQVGPADLPQTFETSDDVEVRPAWNSLPAAGTAPQVLGFGRDHIWLRGPSTTLRVGDPLLVVGRERAEFGRSGVRDDREKWDFRRVVAVEPGAGGHTGWTRLALDRPIGFQRGRELVAEIEVTVHSFATRGHMFGWNAPDPNLLASEGHVPDGAVKRSDGSWIWSNYAATSGPASSVIEIDGEHPEVLRNSWTVLEQPGTTESYRVKDVEPDGGRRYALTGPLTSLTLDIPDGLARFARARATVHCGSGPLPTADEPATAAVTGRVVTVVASDPPLPDGRRILLRGVLDGTGEPAVESAVVETCVVAPNGSAMDLHLTAELTHRFAPAGLEVLANVAVATHGESVAQVLGSGDGRAAFATFRLRRTPLTYVRATTPEGARPELTVRVDGVAWTPVAALAEAGPTDRVYAIKHDEDGGARIVLGGGARPATGTENVTATYRVGIGAAGAVDAGQIALLPRRPLGVREVTNPAASHDWAPPETLESARITAPLRVRTLDRVVSVADHEDLARGYAGIGPVRADLVWDGRVNRVVVSVLGLGASALSDDLIGDLERTFDAARDTSDRVEILPGTVRWFGVRVEVSHDPAYERPAVVAAVRAALAEAFGAENAALATGVTAAAVLVAARSAPGVAACTMPRLLPLPTVPAPPAVPVLPPDADAVKVVVALPGRWDRDVVPAGGIAPAQLAALAAGAVEVGEMTP